MKSARRLVQMKKTCQPDVCRFPIGTTMSFLHIRVAAACVHVCLRECDVAATAFVATVAKSPTYGKGLAST